MKRCDYCGKEYPDEAVVCAIDGNLLPELLKTVEEPAIAVPPPYIGPSDIDVVYPEYRWSARDGWKFLGMMLVFGVMWLFVLGALYKIIPSFHNWRWGPYGFATMRCVYIALSLLTAAYFARTETWRTFCDAVGLNKKPTQYVWFGVAVALVLRLLGQLFYVLGWARGYTHYDTHAFRTTHGPERYLFLFGLLAAAFVEEPVYRGFLYKAFRGSYSVWVSMAIVLGYTVNTHWDQYRHFGFAVISLSALTLVQCYLREKSNSLWDCILCHLVFNGSSLFVSGILRY